MSRKVVLATFFIAVLIGTLGLSFAVQRVEASGTIYIRADGSIDPPTVPISTVDNITYTFTGDIINNSIVAERDNIVVDGAGYTVQGTGSTGYEQSKGIVISMRSNITIKNTRIASFQYGIYTYPSLVRSRLLNNTITENYVGVWLSVSSNNTISGNNITNNWNEAGIYVIGSSSYNTISGNNIANNSDGIHVIDSSSYNSISENNVTANRGNGIVLYVSSSYNSISGNNVANNGRGISFDSSSNNTISGNNMTANNYYGIWLVDSGSNSIFGNNITNNDGDGIWLESSSGNSISGNNVIGNGGDGIVLYNSSSYNSISGNDITANNYDGIYLYYSLSNIISGNNITNNYSVAWLYYDGIYLYYSSNNSISGNKFISNGLFVRHSYQNSVENNTVNDRPLVYLEGISNYTVDDAGQVILVKCEKIRVEGLNLSRTAVGVELWETSNSTISGNNMTANGWAGVSLDNSSSYNSISGNDITANNWDGIYLYYSSNFNSISGNKIANNGDGVRLDSSSSNILSGNNITDNDYDGVLLVSFSSYNIVSGNNITANNRSGILLYNSSSYNSIFHNNFINNAEQVYSSGSVNVWDNGYPSGGNYWSDYTGVDLCKGPYQNETGSDGIGDTQYSIDLDNADRYPLMSLWVRLRGDINGDGIVDIYDAILLANAYNSTPEKVNWNPNADINGDNIVDIYDAILLANHYGQHYP